MALESVMIEALTRPIQENEIEWRVSASKEGTILVVPYVDSRAVRGRLNEAFGIFGWQSNYREIEGGFICSLTILGEDTDGKDWNVTKEDGANRTKIEPIKGGISDSLKRAAVNFGIGENLYNYPSVWIHTNNKYIPKWAKVKLNNLVKLLNEGNKKDVVMLKENG